MKPIAEYSAIGRHRYSRGVVIVRQHGLHHVDVCSRDVVVPVPLHAGHDAGTNQVVILRAVDQRVPHPHIALDLPKIVPQSQHSDEWIRAIEAVVGIAQIDHLVARRRARRHVAVRNTLPEHEPTNQQRVGQERAPPVVVQRVIGVRCGPRPNALVPKRSDNLLQQSGMAG